MKVLMIAPCPYNLQNIKGGVEAVTVNLLQGFKHIDEIEMCIVSIRREVLKKEIVKYSDKIKIHYIPYGKIKSTKFEMLFHGRKEVRKIVDKFDPDIVHVQGNGTVLFLTLGLKKDNLIITQHGIIKEELKHLKTLFRKLNHFISLIIERIYAKNIKNWIFVSEYSQKITKKKYISEQIYNPVNQKFFTTPSLENAEKDRIIYVGGIQKLKGLIDLLKVIKKLKEKNIIYYLDVVGETIEPIYRKEINNYISINCLSENIRFHGGQSQNEILKLMNDVSILVVPSYHENLPVTIAEGMAAGKVVIASNVGGIPEMIHDGKNGFIYESKKLHQLFNILKKINHNKSILREISAEAKISALEKYHPQKVAKKTLEFYKSVINK